MRVAAVVLLALAVLSAAPPARAERESARGAAVVPASEGTAWAWLRAATAPNDAFVDGDPASPALSRAAPPIRGTVRTQTETAAFIRRWRDDPAVTRFAFANRVGAWTVVVDRSRRTVLYTEGCCSYERVVVARYADAPPAAIANAALAPAALRAPVRLGDSDRRVFAMFGPPARRLTAAGTSRWAVKYRQPWYDPRLGTTVCEDDRTIVFEAHAVVAYEAWRGC